MSAKPKTVVEVEETLDGLYMQNMHSGTHVLVADEPEGVGGNDAGPGPYEYLLMGLGACTNMTLRMYAERKQLPLERVKVRLSHNRLHAEDCGDCETIAGMIDEITREIRLEGKLNNEQKKRLLEIADRCPVHRTLTSEIKIRSKLID